MLTKILIANRGEIACRVIRTAKQLGIRTVAVCSEPDRNAQHVQLADEAVVLGGTTSAESYLQVDKVIDAARRTRAQAIHPGYGFLSENEDFAKACEDNDIIFIGPPQKAIAAMGSKSAAKTIMEEAGVPLVPGYHGDDQNDDVLKKAANDIGYPVLLKAAYGGGGKGMRIVNNAGEFEDALNGARREASASFGNDKMLVEKYIQKPRHVEIQVFCDKHGNAVYLGERDCSVQRRHQKVIEEAPAPGLDEKTRDAMGQAAIRAAQAIDYVGAGTVEFLFDEDKSFYFMEMNTRLQVEHPVTEMITGVDLVEWQLKVADGAKLPLKQDEIQLNGHAFEARIYAEDPAADFLPDSGLIEHLRFPPESEHVRVDSGVIENDEVTSFYDPMIAKLIVWDQNRDKALRRLKNALRDTQIAGVTTNTDYLYRIAAHKKFAQAELTTRFLEFHGDSLEKTKATLPESVAHAALAALALRKLQKSSPVSNDPWTLTTGWKLNENAEFSLNVKWKGEPQKLTLEQREDFWFLQDKELGVQVMESGSGLSVICDGLRFRASLAETKDGWAVFTDQGHFHYEKHDPLAELAHEEEAGTLTAPMNGTIVAVNVSQGDKVTEGQALVVMEAMKMEYTIKATVNGTVESIYFQPGDLVSDGAELIALEPEAVAEEGA